MDFLKEWLTNIIVFILLATIFDMLLPRSSMQKYTKMIISLLLIVIIITPLLKITSNTTNLDLLIDSIYRANYSEQSQFTENELILQKREIEKLNDAYILEQMSVQLKNDVEEELMDQYDLSIESIDITLNELQSNGLPEDIEKIVVLLTTEKPKKDDIEAVQVVHINTKAPFRSINKTNKETKIATYLAEKWDMAEKVEVVIKEVN